MTKHHPTLSADGLRFESEITRAENPAGLTSKRPAQSDGLATATGEEIPLPDPTEERRLLGL